MQEIIEAMIVASARQFRIRHIYGGKLGLQAWDAAFTIVHRHDYPMALR